MSEYNEYGYAIADRGCGRLPYLWMTMMIKAKVA
nr:hypothetical protein [Mucilaginibacter sp. X5P1]